MIQPFQGSGVRWVNVVASGGEIEAGGVCAVLLNSCGWVLTSQPCPHLMRYKFGPFLP